MNRNLISNFRRCRGTAMVMIIIVSAIITAIVAVISYSASGLTASGSSMIRKDQAYYVAEAGAQAALWRFKHDNTWRADPSGSPATQALTGTVVVDGKSFSYTATCSGAAGNPVLITSTASDESNMSQVHLTVMTASPSVLATSSSSTFDMTSPARIIGSIFSRGSFKSTSNGTVSGDLRSASSIDAPKLAVGGVTQANDATVPVPPDPQTIYDNLKGVAWTYIGSGYEPTLDFDSHPIIFINGNVTIDGSTPMPIGSGTLVVNGTVIFNGTFPADGSTVKMNIVANNDITTNGSFTESGAIYSTGHFRQNGTHNLTGLVDAKLITLHGPTNYTAGALPWFDPRTTAGTASGTTDVITTNYGDAAI